MKKFLLLPILSLFLLSACRTDDPDRLDRQAWILEQIAIGLDGSLKNELPGDGEQETGDGEQEPGGVEQETADVYEVPGAVYKVENGQRYQQHPSTGNWLAVDDRGNWLPLSDQWLLKIHAERSGKMALLIPNKHQDNVAAAIVNGDPGQRGSDHTNGGRTHTYYDRDETGPWNIRVEFKDGSAPYTKTIPAGSTRTDRPGEAGANWKD